MKGKKAEWEKEFDRRWLPERWLKERPEYNEAINLCDEQKQFISKLLEKHTREMVEELISQMKNLREEFIEIWGSDDYEEFPEFVADKLKANQTKEAVE